MAALLAFWGANAATETWHAVAQQRLQARSAVAYAEWWLEQDPQAANLNTSTPSATLSVPPPLDAPAGTVALKLLDPASSVSVGGWNASSVQVGTDVALSAVVQDVYGNDVSPNDLVLNWQATGSGSVSWLAPGVFQATGPGTVSISVPSVTTSGGSVIPVASNTVSLTVTGSSSGGSTSPSLTVTPGTATLTLDETQPLTCNFINSSGTESTVQGAWSATGPLSLSTAPYGVLAQATGVGTGTVSCSYTSGGVTYQASVPVNIVYPTRIVTAVPQGGSTGTQAVVKVAGPDAAITSWIQR